MPRQGKPSNRSRKPSEVKNAASCPVANQESSAVLPLTSEKQSKPRSPIAQDSNKASVKDADTASDDNRPLTSPDLFANGSTTRMASAMPLWEASSILTQQKDLSWHRDEDGRLCYAKDLGNGEGAVHFWVTQDVDNEYPAALAGAAALAVVDAFDIRAACMHLIYAAHAAQVANPWEQDLVIDDRQLEEYLGLKKRSDKNRQQKLALIEELVKQPCKISTFISCPAQGKVKGFTLEEGRLWHLLGTRYHYQEDLLGGKELIGITFIIRAGLWAKYFLNEEGRKNHNAYYQAGTLSKTLLESVMSVWHHREGAARLMVWLLFKTQFNRSLPLNVQALMEVAYGAEKVERARHSSELRKKLVANWDEDLVTLSDHGWKIQFDPETYPLAIQPPGFGRETTQRPRGFFENLLAARLWIAPEEALINEVAALETTAKALTQATLLQVQPKVILLGSQVRALRLAQGWSQRKLASLSRISQGLISLIENGERGITLENEAVFKQVFGIDSEDLQAREK